MYPYLPPHRSGLLHKGHIIKVTGEGELEIPPDLASVKLGVIMEGKELIAAQQQNTVEMTKVINELRALGIPQDHLQTFDYRIESEYDYDQGKQLFRGYKITHLLEVKIEELSLIGKVVDTAVQNGANYVSNIQFTVKNKESYYLKSMVLALNQAIEKARTIAATINATLIPTPSLVMENESTVQPFYHPTESFAKISSTQFEPGQIKVKASISAEYHYQANI